MDNREILIMGVTILFQNQWQASAEALNCKLAKYIPWQIPLGRKSICYSAGTDCQCSQCVGPEQEELSENLQNSLMVL